MRSPGLPKMNTLGEGPGSLLGPVSLLSGPVGDRKLAIVHHVICLCVAKIEYQTLKIQAKNWAGQAVIINCGDFIMKICVYVSK